MPPRTRAAAEAVSARRNVLTDTDLLSLVFEQLDATSLCRAVTVCKKWQETEVEKHWRALLASRWPHSDDLLGMLRKLDDYAELGMVSKTMFRQYVRKARYRTSPSRSTSDTNFPKRRTTKTFLT